MRTMAILAAPVALLLGSCTYLTGDDSVLVTSTPPGARILLDGADTGMTTPTLLALDGAFGSDHAITLRKAGFVDETRKVMHYTTAYTSNWFDGAVAPELPSFFVWWTFGDMFLPFAVRWRYVPHEVHAVLYKPGEGPVQEERKPEDRQP